MDIGVRVCVIKFPNFKVCVCSCLAVLTHSHFRGSRKPVHRAQAIKKAVCGWLGVFFFSLSFLSAVCLPAIRREAHKHREWKVI